MLELSQFHSKQQQKHCIPCFSLEMFSSPSAIGKTRCADNLISHSSKSFAACNEIKDGKQSVYIKKISKLLVYIYLTKENSFILRKNKRFPSIENCNRHICRIYQRCIQNSVKHLKWSICENS